MRIAAVGSGRTVHALARSAAIAARGHAVRLVTVGPVLPADGIEVRTRPIPASLPGAVAAFRSFVEDVRSFEPDLLHLHYAGGRLGTLATLTGVRPLVVTVMGGDVLPEQHLGKLGRLERRATRRILEQADLILVKSDALRAALHSFGELQGRVETVRWGVDPGVFHRDVPAGRALRDRLGLAADDRAVLSPRILAPLYNIHHVVEAMPRVLAAEPRAVLLLAEPSPDAAYRRRLEAQARGLGLAERVRFIGRLEHRDMPALYSLAEVVVSVPASDGLPQTLFEAMACEAPAVLGRLASYAEAVEDGRSAVLAELTPEGIAQAVTGLLRDDARRASIASEAAERVRQIALLPREVDRVVGFYQELLDRPRRAPAGRFLDALSLLVR